MKLLYIHTYYKQRGGEDTVFENETQLMREAGVKVECLLFYNQRFTALKFLLFFFNPLSFIRTWRAISRFRPDAIHVHNWFFAASPAVFIAARWRKVPVFHTIHNFRILCPSGCLFYRDSIFADSVSKVFPLEAIRKKVYRDSTFNTFWLLTGTRLHYFLRTWQRIDRFICLTEAAKSVLCSSYLRLPEERIAVKPHFFAGHSPATATGTALRGNHRTGDFLFVGRLSPEKGIDILLDAFEKNGRPLKIIGDGPLREKVERSARECPNIQYLGFRDKSRIIEELYSCTALVLTTTGFEQFGMVIVEAFYCGTAVIVPDTGSPAELVTDGRTGLHFQAGSPEDLRITIANWLIIPPAEQEAYRERARDTYQERYTPAINRLQLLTIYKSLLHETNADFEFPDQHREISGLHRVYH